MKYEWQARSPSDVGPTGLGFETEDDAIHHCSVMNELLEEYDDPSSSLWNKDYWKSKPKPWVHFKV